MSKKKIEIYSQCVFVKEDTGSSTVHTTAYIDAAEAKVGARMTLKGVEGIWMVESAGPPEPPPRHHAWGSMD